MTTITPNKTEGSRITAILRGNISLIAITLAMIALPFIIALIDGQPFGEVLANETGNAKFIQGLMIEIFILAIYAISYDLILGITGLLSFGHAMFFAAGAYGAGIMFKNLEWGILPTVGGIFVIGIVQALLFAIVLPRVKGITFALVTLGLASVFHIVIQSNEVGQYTGADVGLQGVISPEFLNTSTERFNLYLIGLALTILIYIFYRRFVDSPTGRVCVAIRENEDRALMLGFNTFYFKLAALTVSSITAALAGLLHTLHAPIVSPNVAGLGYTVLALLIILIGGMGTLSGAMVGAAVYRLLEYFLDKRFEENASFILGLIYVLLVLFLPFGIVGTWQVRRHQIRQWWQRLRNN